MLVNHAEQKLPIEKQNELLHLLKARFQKNMARHEEFRWTLIQERLEASPSKIWSLNEMELTGGAPDVVAFDDAGDGYMFIDCSSETPKGRRSTCYDREGLESRKEAKPENNAVDMATAMGIDILNEEQYKTLQKFGPFDAKTSSWLKTPESIRALGGAIFGDYRYGMVFIYHNGAQSYYSSRGFRGLLRV